MIDLDAPFADKNRSISQILHWMQPGVTESGKATTKKTKYRRTMEGRQSGGIALATNGTSQAAIAPYISPSPPAGSDAHRYVILLYNQQTTSKFALPAQFAGFNAMNRTKFDLAGFQKAAGLSDPVAANWFLVRPGDNSTDTSSGMNSGSSSSSGSNSTGKGSGGSSSGGSSSSNNTGKGSNSSNPATFQGVGSRGFGGMSLFAIDAAMLGAVWMFFVGAL